MSHFTVLVIGEDYEGQLAPYNEEIQVEPYKSHEKDAEWLYGVWEKEHGGHQRPQLEELAAWLSEHWGEPYECDEDGIFTWSTYSPNSKWDWYSVGGRWTGYFKLTEAAMDRATYATLGRPGVFDNELPRSFWRGPRYDADVVHKGDVDAEGMRDKAGEIAGDRWDRIHAIIDSHPEIEPWVSVLKRIGNDKTDEAREVYHAQPGCLAVREHDDACREEERHEDVLLGWSSGLEEFQISREIYVQRARDEALSPYAFVKDGRWFAPGRMGWWGVSSDTEDERVQFAREFNVMWEELPDDTLLTLCDCHI